MENRYITVQYKMYAPMGEDRRVELIEQTREDMPFVFVSGMGRVLEVLEQRLAALAAGEQFKIVLSEDEAYGPYIPEGVQEVPLEAFLIEGKLDTDRIYEGAVVPMMNDTGEQFNATIAKINEKSIIVDLNHPLAGKELTFEGHVVENRLATNEEIQQYLKPRGCGGCGGGGCSGGCGSGGCGGCDGTCE